MPQFPSLPADNVPYHFGWTHGAKAVAWEFPKGTHVKETRTLKGSNR